MIVVAIMGVAIAYLFMAIFTKHGEQATVPKVENMSYTKAIELLHSKGFNVDIRDSLYRDDIKPGFVIEQFPRAKSIVKPGRKIFLYINAVHPKEVIIDDGADRTALALKNRSYRDVKSRLMGFGFKNIRTISVLGEDDRVVKILAHGRPVFNMQKVPINAPIIIEISDGRLGALRDSLYTAEQIGIYQKTDFGIFPGAEPVETSQKQASSTQQSAPGTKSEESAPQTEYFDDPEYFIVEDEMAN